MTRRPTQNYQVELTPSRLILGYTVLGNCSFECYVHYSLFTGVEYHSPLKGPLTEAREIYLEDGLILDGCFGLVRQVVVDKKACTCSFLD